VRRKSIARRSNSANPEASKTCICRPCSGEQRTSVKRRRVLLPFQLRVGPNREARPLGRASAFSDASATET
jgi:hypothetical protein